MTTRGMVRVLAIPAGQTEDADGREVGSDWLLADCGEAHDGTHYYVTTDYIRASELDDYPLLADPRRLAEWMVEAINAGYEQARRGRR